MIVLKYRNTIKKNERKLIIKSNDISEKIVKISRYVLLEIL